ncbi:hypothetical protein FCM35_KLT15394 [Carex littledalei]|uniref:Uncharacterized protein n=1 Tax=Carex littledalei TaxID=544730 RepID=A0A833RR57_9POAL|nr:hypothetical protein FCM35_KLT15394 [Carex littledalei]
MALSSAPPFQSSLPRLATGVRTVHRKMLYKLLQRNYPKIIRDGSNVPILPDSKKNKSKGKDKEEKLQKLLQAKHFATWVIMVAPIHQPVTRFKGKKQVG